MRELNAGDLLDARYRIEGRLGEGGFAVVYRGTELSSGRPVAAKVLTAGKDGYTADQLARFEREVAIIKTLRDPHTVRMYGHGRTADGAPYAVFELVDGRELAEIVRASGPLPPAVVEHILRQLLYALREAHHKGLVHRDLKPENILVYANGADPWAVKLLDFGIARPMNRQDARLTATGELIGTPRYMSPEQLTDAPLSPASDIYSLGVVAFELLFGTEALHGGRWGDQLDRLQAHYEFVAPPPAQDLGALPELIRHMTERRVEQRIPTAAAALGRLDGLRPTSDREPLPAREVKPTARLGLRWLVAVAGLAVLAVLALLGVVATILTRTPDAPPARAATSPPQGVAASPLLKPAPGARAPEPPPTPPAPAAAKDGCGEPPPFVGSGKLPARSRLDPWPIYIPKDYEADRRHPVVILLHDSGQDAEVLLNSGGFPQIADAQHFVVLAPGDNPLRPWEDGEDDRRVEMILDLTADELCIDRSRVFLAAHGDGGRVARRLTCANWITGAAIFSFRSLRRAGLTRHCEVPQPHLYIAPLDSGFEPIAGGTDCGKKATLSLEDYDAMLRSKNQCTGPPHSWAPGKPHCETWDCAKPYVRCKAPGGRTWPDVPRLTRKDLLPHLLGRRRAESDPNSCDGPATEIALAEHMWKFFATLDPLDPPPAPEGSP